MLAHLKICGVAFPELGKEASIEKDLNIEIGTVKGKRGWRGILQFLSLPVAAARDKGGFGGAAQFFNISTISLTTADFCQLEILPEMLFFFSSAKWGILQTKAALESKILSVVNSQIPL